MSARQCLVGFVVICGTWLLLATMATPAHAQCSIVNGQMVCSPQAQAQAHQYTAPRRLLRAVVRPAYRQPVYQPQQTAPVVRYVQPQRAIITRPVFTGRVLRSLFCM